LTNLKKKTAPGQLGAAEPVRVPFRVKQQRSEKKYCADVFIQCFGLGSRSIANHLHVEFRFGHKQHRKKTAIPSISIKNEQVWTKTNLRWLT